MSGKTIFQKIIDREIPAKIAFEDELCIAIHDINPQAPIHVLVIPKKTITRITEASPNDDALLGHLLLSAAKIARALNLDNGFRLVINNGKDGGETVPHMHIHLLGGRSLQWPPG